MSNFYKIIKGEIYPYCNCKTELVSDKEIYWHDSKYGGMYFFQNHFFQQLQLYLQKRHPVLHHAGH